MTDKNSLISEPFKKEHAEDIFSYRTFVAQGVSQEEAIKYLRSKDGLQYLEMLQDSMPHIDATNLNSLATNHIITGKSLPTIETINEPLVKIVRHGAEVSPTTPFFAKLSDLQQIINSGESLSNKLGLPVASEAAYYDAYIINPKGQVQVFTSEIAPTSELNGLISKEGGAKQYLVPNRHQFTEPAFHMQLENHQSLKLERPITPGMCAVRALGVAGLAAEAYDVGQTAQETRRHYAQGNPQAAESAVLHLGGRAVGGWSGAVLGATVGAAVGVKTGPGLLVTGAIGSIAGAYGGEKLADWIDVRKIYNQKDAQGNTWTFDPANPQRGWQREARVDDRDDGVDAPTRSMLRASPELDARLSYQATSTSAALLMGSPPLPKDPFTQPANKDVDSHSQWPTSWKFNPVTEQWQRKVVTRMNPDGSPGASHTETASPARAEQLSNAANDVIAQNAANSQAAIAARYEAHYQAQGWATYGAIPDVIQSARMRTDYLQASDGDWYQRQPDGQWKSKGLFFDSTAKDNLHGELEGTRDYLKQYLPPPKQIARPAPLMEEQRLQDTVQMLYQQRGIEASDAQIKAAAAQIQADRTQAGLSPTPTALQLQRYGSDPSGLESDFIHLYEADDGSLLPEGTTKGGDITARLERNREAQATLDTPQTPAQENTPKVQPSPPQNAPHEKNGDTRQHTPQPVTQIPVPADLRDSQHPDHAGYVRMLGMVHAMEKEKNIPPGEWSEKLAAGLLVASRERDMEISRLVLKDDGHVQAFEQQGNQRWQRSLSLSSKEACNTLMLEHGEHWKTQQAATQGNPNRALLESALSREDMAILHRIRDESPQALSDAQAMQLLARTRQAGIRHVDDIEHVVQASTGHIWVLSKTPGFRADINPKAEADSIEESQRQLQTQQQNEEMAQQRARQQENMRISMTG